MSRPLSVKTPLGRLSLSKTSGAKSVSKTAGEEESLERCTQSIVENSVSLFFLFDLKVKTTCKENWIEKILV